MLPSLPQSLFDLATKPCSVAFDAYRDESYVNGGEDYLTFSGCTVNIGNGKTFSPSLRNLLYNLLTL